MKTVVIGMLGPMLDRGEGAARWQQWRPSVAVCQQEEHLIDRFELLYEHRFTKLAEQVARDIRSVSPETQVRLQLVAFKDPWDFEEVYGALHDFARAYPFDTEREQYLLHLTTGTHVAQICLFLLAESRHFPAQLLQTAPPKREDAAGPGEFRIIDLDLSRYDRIAQRFHREQREGVSFLKSGIETRNKAFNKLIEQIEHVAIHSRSPILLTGPTGAGKSQLARKIYELKHQRRQVAGRFVEVNCATLRGDGAMSALFGHRKGAFTGAVSERAGLLREAHGGLLFLDEIGELPLDEQAMLLRAVEEKRFLPMGADREVESEFQLICGTNRDLPAAVREGRFREDLLARINLWSFRLPRLAERREDIEPNVQYELERIAAATGQQVRFNREAWRRFVAFATSSDATWAANFRDLSAAMSRMSTFAPAGRINLATVEEEIARLTAMWTGLVASEPVNALAEILSTEQVRAMDPFDAVQLAEVARVCRQSKSLSEAGRRLFAVSRTNRTSTNDADRLRKYLARFDLQWSSFHAQIDERTA